MSPDQWSIRSAKADDVNFIYTTWLRSYQDDSAIGRSCFKSVFFRNYQRVIDRILSRDDTQTLVACLPNEIDVVLGYAVIQGQALHYVYVKDAFRNMGVAKSLIEPFRKTLTAYTHRTRMVTPILARCLEFEYNPFLLFQQEEPQGDPAHGPTPRRSETHPQLKTQSD